MRRLRGERSLNSKPEMPSCSPRNRRILRHYIELSVDGKLGDVDDIVAVAALPTTDAPVNPPVTLAGATSVLPRPSRARMAGAALLGLAVIATAAGLVWYNLTYQLQGTGFVNGSIARITANHDGQVVRMLVQPGSPVEPNTALFTVDNPALRTEVQALEQHIATLVTGQARLHQLALGGSPVQVHEAHARGGPVAGRVVVAVDLDEQGNGHAHGLAGQVRFARNHGASSW